MAEDTEQESTTEEPVAEPVEPESPEAKAEETTEETESKANPHQVDKGLQKFQARISNIESRLDQVLARFEANPTQANAKAVEAVREKAVDLGFDIDQVNDDDVATGKAFKMFNKYVNDRLKAIEDAQGNITAKAGQWDQASTEAIIRRAETAFLGEFPGLTSEDFQAGFEEAAARVRSYGQLPPAAADKLMGDLLMDFGKRRGSGEVPASPRPKTVSASPKVITKGGAGLRQGQGEKPKDIAGLQQYWADNLRMNNPE